MFQGKTDTNGTFLCIRKKELQAQSGPTCLTQGSVVFEAVGISGSSKLAILQVLHSSAKNKDCPNLNYAK